ncbi:unnamed protein product [Rhizoctonia solani]|uniref:Uncharacterized protein n=1 Tax=Rhizoctonia solani TaxID=456999 RepID=A0A8H2ZYS0_9AGAM|nr:unnamed protein product [Rhizoctonia solani]
MSSTELIPQYNSILLQYLLRNPLNIPYGLGLNPLSFTRAYLVAFFAMFPGFVYNPTQPALSELMRMKAQFGWEMQNFRTSTLPMFRRALVLQFNLTFGTDQNDLVSWQNLCRIMGVVNIPDNLTACKKLVESIYVNLIDLVDMPNTGVPVRLFKREYDLSEYTLKTDKIFPKDDAHAGGLLKHLLRNIIAPRRGGKTRAKTAKH